MADAGSALTSTLVLMAIDTLGLDFHLPALEVSVTLGRGLRASERFSPADIALGSVRIAAKASAPGS